MKHPRIVSLIATGVLGVGLLAATPAEAAPPVFEYLDPGGQPSLVEELPVNVVFIGFDRDDVMQSEFEDGLPATYEPVVQSRLWYGVEEKLGITYEYDYRIKFASEQYENRLFAELSRLAEPAPLTLFQEEYNNQVNNVLDVADNHFIDAPSVEEWLAENAPDGVNTRRNTVYFINWWDRPDFKFHVYTKMDEPDPDTGYNFGELRESRKIVAWGGTTARDEENGLGSIRRVWFYDISAGPESWGGNSNVDDADLDGDDVPDYRIPVIWEYGAGAYRPASELSGDLAKLTRYVALDLLFTTSPIYPVELPTDEPPKSINMDSNTYEAWPGVDASREYITKPLLMSELRPLLRRNKLTYDNQDLPWGGEAERCYELWLDDVSCYPDLGFPGFANLYLQNLFEFARTQDDGDRVDYELPIFNYSTEVSGGGLLGYADDNYVDGTQTFVFAFVSTDIVEAGYGLTTTLIHEVGHHVGLSHPHDGYDSEDGTDFGPSGDTFFAWAGDESNTIMSYIDLNWDFSQFDFDNMDRFQTAALIEAANRLAGEALEADDPEDAYDELREADRAVGRAERLLAGHQYRDAMFAAQRAYNLAAEGAEDAGVDVDAVAKQMRQAQLSARQSTAVHQPGEFIDTLEEGPRSQP
jgi:hypothetical protein